MNDRERTALETMTAWRAVRDTYPLGSKEYEQADQEFKKAEIEYYRARD